MKISLKYVVAILSVLLLAFGALHYALPLLQQQRQIHLADYITMEFDGPSKYATASATFSETAFRKDYEKRYGKAACDAIAALCAHGIYEPASKLSNGDTVTFHWDDEKAATIAKQYDLPLDTSACEFTVSGLKKAETFYPFYGLSLDFSGLDGSGEAIRTGTPEGSAAELSFHITPSSGLYNGDTVRLVASAPDGSDLDTYCMAHFGKLPSKDEKEYTVRGLDANLTSLNQLADGEILSLAARARGSYEDSLVPKYADGQSFSGMQLAAATLLINDPQSKNHGVDNYLILTFAIDVHNTQRYDTGEVYDADNRFYWNILYRDLNVNRDGNLSADFETPRLYANGLTHIYATAPREGNAVRWDNDGYATLDDALDAAENTASHFLLANEWIY